jgi:hypothetical protein
VDKLDRVGAQLPRQLGAWDGATLMDVGKGIAHGKRDIVCKISDSYLGIGDHVFKRGVDFTVGSAPLLYSRGGKGPPAVQSRQEGPPCCIVAVGRAPLLYSCGGKALPSV